MVLLVEELAKGLKRIQKPAKMYLHNTNLLYAYCDNAKIGTVRETFFVNQVSYTHTINVAKYGDFIVDKKYTFEIGGRGKDFSQIKDIKNSFLVLDGIQKGEKRVIPLWLFGFLY